MAAAPIWSADEDQVIREMFPDGGSAACADVLRRTRKAINRRASLLRIGRATGWRSWPLTVAQGACSPKRPAIERWHESYDIAADGCWNWRGVPCHKGYAHFRDDSGRKVAVHRFAYETAKGKIPDGLVLDHLCRNRGCCNPDHLEAVTNRENVLRGAIGQIQKTVTHCKRGHEYSPENVWIEPNGGRRCRTCARERDRQYALRKRLEAA